jgi:hypothetical protein
LTPDVEEDFADQVLRGRFITNQPQHEPEHPHMMPGKQHLHREPVAVSDPSNQDFVRSGWVR